MKYILIALLFISGVASAQFTPTGSKTRFVNGIGLGSKLDAAFGTADSLVLYTKLDSTLMFKYKGTARALMYAANVSSLIHDSLYAVYQLKAGTSAGIRLISNSGTNVALFGAGGGAGTTLYGQLNGDAIIGTSFGVNGVASAFRQYVIQTSGSGRWALQGQGTESGSNTGTDFSIARYDDAGANIDKPFEITRSTGIVKFLYVPVFTAGLGAISATSGTFSSTGTFGNSAANYQLNVYKAGAVDSYIQVTSGGGGNGSGNGLLVGVESNGDGKINMQGSQNFKMDIAGVTRWSVNQSTSTQTLSGTIVLSGLGTGTVYSNSGTLTNTNPSDSTLKDSIMPMRYGLAEVLKLKPKTFYYKSDSAHTSLKYGFIAQDVKPIMPDIVRKIDPKDPKSKLGLETDGIYVTLVKAIQEQQAIIEDLKKRIAALENK